MTAKYEHDDIARIAYRSWLDRGQPEGSPEIDWYYALSVVTNPEEIHPVPFGSFAADSSSEDSDELETQFSDGSLRGSQRESSSDGTADWPGLREPGLRDGGMGNDTDVANDDSGDNEVTRRSEQFNVDQKASPTPRSRKKTADGKDKQGVRVR